MNEISRVQNAGFCALVLWRFSDTYVVCSGREVPLPVLFLVLPVVMNPTLRSTINSTNTQSGLNKVIEKLATASRRDADLIESINSRAMELRELTTRSLRLMLRLNVASLKLQTAGVIVSSFRTPKSIAVNHKPVLAAADKLGTWLSHMSLYEAALVLRVRF